MRSVLAASSLATVIACGGDPSVAAQGTEGSSSDGSTSPVGVDTTDPSGTPTAEGSGGGSSTTDTTTASDASTAASSESSSDGGVVIPGCPAGDLGAAVPGMVEGNTFAQTDAFVGPCGGAGPDLAYTFTAPADGPYTFDTRGSLVNTVLYVLGDVCMGEPLGCDDDGDGQQSALAVELVAGQAITVVVDSASELGGPFVLRVREGSLVCPAGDLGALVPNTVGGDTTDQFRGHSSSCGGGAGPDAGYLFTPPADGTYTFDTFGASFDGILTVRDGACDGAELACGYGGVLTELDADQTVVVFVDSAFASGPFELHVGALGGACPDGDLGSGLPALAVGDTSVGDNTTAGSCGGFTQPDDLYLFTAVQDGLYIFDTAGSAFDTVLYVRDGGCDGAELGCDDAGGGQPSQLALPLGAGQTVMVAVDGGTASGAYALTIEPVACPDEDLGSDLPQSVDGTTLGAFDKVAMVGCGAVDATAPDYVLEWTAPAAGPYTFDTEGSDYDTVLYVQDAACGGNELGCNDDAIGLQSSVTVDLAGGQTVVLVVSGWNNAAGNFTVNLD